MKELKMKFWIGDVEMNAMNDQSHLQETTVLRYFSHLAMAVQNKNL